MRVGAAAALAAIALFTVTQPVAAQEDELYIRVVDVGAGLCVVAVAPGGHVMVFDGGRGASLCAGAVRELVPSRTIDLMILSHSDIDHVGAVSTILSENSVRTILHPGDPRGPALKPIRDDIRDEPGADIWNLSERRPQPGQVFGLGEATVTFIAGWSDGNETRGPDEPPLDHAGRNNALSIVVRLDYRGRSVLLTGDTVGRPISPDDSLCRYAERIMVGRADELPLVSDVLIGQHHGGDNATSNCFIRAVKPLDPARPLHVVFSAGSMYRHPRQSVADRLVANGVDPANMFRTDRGDCEPGAGRDREWVTGTIRGCTRDRAGDDDVEITLSAGLPVKVRYRR